MTNAGMEVNPPVQLEVSRFIQEIPEFDYLGMDLKVESRARHTRLSLRRRRREIFYLLVV